MKILVVEDNTKNRILIRDTLIAEGYEVLEATDGVEGVSQAKEHMPDLILMDIQMPVMNGVETMKILKAGAETKGIKIIALTAVAMQGDKERFLAEGFDGYLSKPVDPDTVIKTVIAMSKG